jgi:hypothetical protein
MTPQQIIGVGIRLFAIWLGLQTLQWFAAMPSALSRAGFDSSGPAYMIAIGYLAAALALWHFPMVLAHKIVPRTRYSEHLSPQLLDLARVGCALLGLWLLIRTLPAMVGFLFRAYLASGSGSIFGTLALEAKLDLAYQAVEFAIALFLVLRSESAARFILRAGSQEGQAEPVDAAE